MNKTNKILCAVFVISVFFFAFSYHLPAVGQEKIALVNLQRALNEVEEGKKAKAAIQADMEAKKKQLDILKEELKKMRDDLEQKKMVLSKEALDKKANEIQTKFLDLQQKAVQYDQELKQKESESVQKILIALKKMVVDVAKNKGFDIVYENSVETVLYTSKGVDITNDVITAYNNR